MSILESPAYILDMSVKQKEDRYIPGVYNYCDRLCERCKLKDRCFLYAKEKMRIEEHRRKGEDPDDWSVVLADIERSFGKAMEFLKRLAAKEGIESEPIQASSSLPDPSSHPLYKLSQDYMKRAHLFLEGLRGKIEKYSEDLQLCGQVSSDIREIISNYETVLWYHTLIPVKISRALTSKFEAEENSISEMRGIEEVEHRQFAREDAAGSAKVAYYGLAMTISALQAIYEWDRDDEVIALLALADSICRMLDKEISSHRLFKHPWFEVHPIK